MTINLLQQRYKNLKKYKVVQHVLCWKSSADAMLHVSIFLCNNTALTIVVKNRPV